MPSCIAAIEDKIYVAGLAGTLALWQHAEKVPEFVKCWHDGRDGVEGIGDARAICIDSERRVWVSGTRQSAVAWFDRLNSRGILTYGGKLEVNASVQGLAPSADGKFIYAVAPASLLVIDPYYKPPPAPNPERDRLRPPSPGPPLPNP